MLDVLKHISRDKSPLADQGYPRAQWENREEFVGSLIWDFCIIICHDKVPEVWSRANMVLLFKMGCREKPVSLTSVVVLLESILQDKMCMHLER